MPRNLDRRVEALTPVSDPHLTARLDEILEVTFTPIFTKPSCFFTTHNFI
jgi:polyphosphate kinase